MTKAEDDDALTWSRGDGKTEMKRSKAMARSAAGRRWTVSPC